jgi:acyl-CoA synthetase (AMP-forming)/AMP-acid ligase II
MTNQSIGQWISKCDLKQELLFLSNEHESWSYSQLADALRWCDLIVKDLEPSTCIIEGDYSLYSVAWLLTGLSYGWRMVPVVSKKITVIDIRSDISDSSYRVSSKTNWKLESLPSKTSSVLRPKIKESGVILFSSGSTGEPKAMCKNMDTMLEDLLKQKPRPITMGLLLLFDHIGGLNTLFSGLKKFSHLVAPAERSPRIMAKLIQSHSVRVLPCSPTFLNMMYLDNIFEEFNLKSLRMITYGTERMPEELLNRLVLKLPKVKFIQTFGTSETGIVQTKSLSSSSTFFTIDDPSIEWKIVDKELWIKSKSQISSYLNTSEEAIEEGWFKTGDLIEHGSDKYFRIIGRKKEVINVGGEKVMPGEIEDYIMSIDCVTDCTAFSVPNAITGQAVGVRVVVAEDIDLKVLKKNIRQLCKLRMERFKIPAKIIFDFDLKPTDRFKKER